MQAPNLTDWTDVDAFDVYLSFTDHHIFNWGVTINFDSQPFIVTKVDEGQWGRLQVKRGWAIWSINNEFVNKNNAMEFRKLLQEGKPCDIAFIRPDDLEKYESKIYQLVQKAYHETSLDLSMKDLMKENSSGDLQIKQSTFDTKRLTERVIGYIGGDILEMFLPEIRYEIMSFLPLSTMINVICVQQCRQFLYSEDGPIRSQFGYYAVDKQYKLGPLYEKYFLDKIKAALKDGAYIDHDDGILDIQLPRVLDHNLPFQSSLHPSFADIPDPKPVIDQWILKTQIPIEHRLGIQGSDHVINDCVTLSCKLVDTLKRIDSDIFIVKDVCTSMSKYDNDWITVQVELLKDQKPPRKPTEMFEEDVSEERTIWMSTQYLNDRVEGRIRKHDSWFEPYDDVHAQSIVWECGQYGLVPSHSKALRSGISFSITITVSITVTVKGHIKELTS